MEGLQMLPTLHDPNEIDGVLEEIKKTKFIGEVTHQEIEQFASKGTIRFLYEGHTLLGFGAWKVINNAWCEIGPLYIVEEARARGISRQIIDEMFAINAAYNLYLVTKNPIIGHLANQYKFAQIPLAKLPRPIKLYLIRKFNLTRIVHLITKFSRDPVLHFVRKA